MMMSTRDVLEGLHRLTEGRSATWELHCIAPPENEGMVCKLQTSQLDMAYIKGRFPPGEYKIIGRDDRGSYIRGSHKSFKLSALGSSGATVAAESAGGDLAGTLKSYMEAQAAREREAATQRKDMLLALGGLAAPIVAAIISRPARPDPMASLGPILAALKPGAEQTSLKDLVATMVSLQQLNGGGGNQLERRIQGARADQGSTARGGQRMGGHRVGRAEGSGAGGEGSDRPGGRAAARRKRPAGANQFPGSVFTRYSRSADPAATAERISAASVICWATRASVDAANPGSCVDPRGGGWAAVRGFIRRKRGV